MLEVVRIIVHRLLKENVYAISATLVIFSSISASFCIIYQEH